MEEVSISHINSDKRVVISWVEKTLEADFNSGFSLSALGPAFYAGLLSLPYLVEWLYVGISPMANAKTLGEKNVQKIL